MIVTSWITGLMAQNYEALGFIPNTTVERRYVAKSRYILQKNKSGRPVGYLLHGVINPGRAVVVSQHCIEYDKRARGYGQLAFEELKRRAQIGNGSSIVLRCAVDLSALDFWQSVGFQIIEVVPGGVARNRLVAKMVYPLTLPIFDYIGEAGRASLLGVRG